MSDQLILGGHAFDSRFILGSGKFSLELVRAVAEKAVPRWLRWHCAAPMRVVQLIF